MNSVEARDIDFESRLQMVLTNVSKVRGGLFSGYLVHDFSGKNSPLALEVYDQAGDFEDNDAVIVAGPPVLIRVPGQMALIEPDFAEFIASKFSSVGFLVTRVKER